MSKRRDDTTEPPEGSRPDPEAAPRGYYYDDGTGYEVYRPEEEEKEEETGGSASGARPCDGQNAP
jgi:hypothetical protein